ncbi:hypothetical protein Cni_G24897 [Canna indica]|uniref:Anther-specific protein BCP1 n=1 Tax=Canna indica TaxID=4628 RepID=A0AAQ3KX04_9LILI|nr:hypothetical protein Cni_G24897 [Canna indica]
MARSQLLVVVLAIALLMALATPASSDSAPIVSSSAGNDSKPSVLNPLAKSPLPSDADAPSEAEIDDSDAGGLGAPTGYTPSKPEDDSSANHNASGASVNGVTSMVVVAAISGAGYLVF